MVVMVETQASGQSPAIPLQETPSDTPGLDATVILATPIWSAGEGSILIMSNFSFKALSDYALSE